MGCSFKSGIREAASTPQAVRADASKRVTWVLKEVPGSTRRRSGPVEPGFVWAPFSKIPNVRTFTVTVADVDKLFDLFGIRKKHPPVIEWEPYANRASLRYAEHMIRRLRGCRSNDLYWKMVWVLMSRSIVFTLMAVSKSFDR